MKLGAKTFVFIATEFPSFLEVVFPYNVEQKDHIKAIPGVSWNKEAKRWRFPRDCKDIIAEYLESKGLIYQGE